MFKLHIVPDSDFAARTSFVLMISDDQLFLSRLADQIVHFSLYLGYKSLPDVFLVE